jgi:ribosomal protein S18 acetylase RimI-like enzyme
MPEIQLEPIRPDALAVLRPLADRYWEGLMPHAPVIRDPERRRRFFDEQFRVDDPGVLLWWAVSDGDRIGFARIELWRNHDGDGATISDFYVDIPWRRQGYGTAFANANVRELEARGVHRIDLNARADNPASLAFWRSAGFYVASYRLRKYLPE